MKHLGSEEVRMAADVIGVRLDPAQARLIADHANWVMATTGRVNLTAITEPSEVLRLHVVDSMLALAEVTMAAAGPGVDIGTGGGFPGFPLGVASRRPMVMLDSVRKKSAALAEFLAQSGWPDGRAVAERAEEHATRCPSAYSFAVARAVADLPALLELASPLLSPGGRLIALKGGECEAERLRAASLAEATGMSEHSVRTECLPGGDERRTILVYTKTGEGSVALPRRTGRAQKRPLA